MAGPIQVVCSGCQTKYQVPPVLAGKKIRCKSCGGAIAVPGVAAKAKAAAAKPAAAATPVAAKPAAGKPSASAAAPAGTAAPGASEEWGQISAYEVIKEVDLPRCPHCAHDMEEGEIVCLNCGYNTITRERLPNKVLEPVTGGDYFMWLLPGIVCVVFALLFLVLAQSIFTQVPYLSFLDDLGFYYSSENKAIPSYLAVFFAFDIWGLGYFAFRRLVLNPHPPDKEKKLDKQAEED